MKPRRLARRVVYRHPWLDLYVDKVRFPAGRLVDHHVVFFKRESAASVVEDRRGRILMIRSYRYVTDSVEWELPAGGIEKNETPLEGARRETLEESGWETTGHRKVYTFHPVNGLSNKVFHVVRSRAVRKAGRFDRNEVKGLRWFTKAELRRLIRRNGIKDGFCLAALTLVLGKFR